MKKLISIITVIIALNTQAQSGFGNDYIFASDNFISVDYQYHFTGGFIFGAVGYMAGLDIYKGDRNKAIWTGVAVGTGAGLVKELTDIGKTGFNTTDLAWSFVGSAVSSWVMDKIHYPNYAKRKKAEIAKLELEYQNSLTDEEKLLASLNKPSK